MAIGDRGPTEAALELSALICRLPSVRRYEPLIVTTLRRYFRRGVPESLVVRLAGGPSAWRQLNERWNLGGRAVGRRAPVAFEIPEALGAHLSIAERRIALLQLADECALAGTVLPTLTGLGRCFGVSRHAIAYDLEVLRESGKLSWRLVSDGLTGVRRAPEPA
jgi:hypothetical protein